MSLWSGWGGWGGWGGWSAWTGASGPGPMAGPGLAWSRPLWLAAGAVLALAVLALGLRAQRAPGFGVRATGQHPLRQGLGLALLLAGLAVGLAEPRWGEPEAPRLTVHVVLDASRSMRAQDAGGGASRWQAAQALLDRLWAGPNPGLRFSLDLLTGDAVPLLPPGEDLGLLRDALQVVQPGAIGSPGSAFGVSLAQAAGRVEPEEPAILLLLSDGEETVEDRPAALRRAVAALRAAQLPLYAIVLGQPRSQPVPDAAGAPASGPPATSTARPDFLAELAQATGGRLLPVADPGPWLQRLAQGRAPLPASRSRIPAHPEAGAWVALLGLALWLTASGKPMRAWRPLLGLALALAPARPGRAALPVPPGVQAWLAQRALAQGDLATARRRLPRGDTAAQRLLAAQILLRTGAPGAALAMLAPLTGQGCRQPIPAWRAPALLMAARAQVALAHPDQACSMLERLLLEQPGRTEAVHDLQSLLPDRIPPPAPPREPPSRPSQGAREDELEGFRQRLPRNPGGGVRDL